MSKELKHLRNLSKALTKSENSVPYGEKDLTKKLIKKLKKLDQEKDHPFVKTFLKVKNENRIDKKSAVPLTTKFTKQKKHINWYSTLYSFDWLFQLLQADVANLEFFDKSKVDLK